MTERKSNLISLYVENKARKADIIQIEKSEANARKLAKKNKNFVQLYLPNLSPLMGLMNRSSKTAQILFAMVATMGQSENALQADFKALESMTGASSVTVRRAIKILVQENWIEAVEGCSHMYRVNSKVFWKSYGDRKAQSFQAELNVPEEEKAINRRVVRKVIPVVKLMPQKSA